MKKKIALFALFTAALGFARRLIRRPRQPSSQVRGKNETMTTQGGEPISQEALMTDVDQSITPGRD
jgi:hypothetical protein